MTEIDDAAALGLRLAQINAPAFVYATAQLTPDEREEFFRAFCAGLSAMAQSLIGHDATVLAFHVVAGLPPVDTTVRPTH